MPLYRVSYHSMTASWGPSFIVTDFIDSKRIEVS